MKRSGLAVCSIGAVLVSTLVGCQSASADSASKSEEPLSLAADPVVEWSFDSCTHDDAWAYTADAVDGTTGSIAGSMVATTMKAEPDGQGGCAARLDFLQYKAGVGMDVVGVAGDGYGLSLKARFPKCPEGLQCRWVFALASREDGEPKSTKLWRYTIEAETINGVTTVEAFGRRESGFGGDDLPKLIVKATEGSVVPDEWHSLALAVNRVKRVMTFWVDGIGQGSAGFDDETFDHIDRLGVFAQAEVPLEVTTQPDVPGLGDESWLPATVYVDDVRLYAFSAAQLDELWQ